MFPRRLMVMLLLVPTAACGGAERSQAAPLDAPDVACVGDECGAGGSGGDVGSGGAGGSKPGHIEDAEPGEPCDVDGETAPCKYVLGTHNGVTDCFVGTSTCEDGVWSTCR